MAFEKELEELEARRARARAMGSPKRLQARREAGILNARERVEKLTDAGSFRELGMLSHSVIPGMEEKSPADGMVSGMGRIDGRVIGINAADFTTLGSSSAMVHGKKQQHVRRMCIRNGHPLVYLMECAGGRIPDIMGATGIGRAGDGAELSPYTRPRTTPIASAVLGLTYGGGAFSCINSDFVVQRKGAVLAVSSEMVTSVAISEDQDPEDWGGWRHHTEHTGFVDAVADSDEEAIEELKRFLSYMPDHCEERPADKTLTAADRAAARAAQDDLLGLVPEMRNKVYDVRKVIEKIFDPGSVFPLKPRFAKTAVTALARLEGKVVGVVASNPMFKGGALDPEACDKITNFIVLCDSFNIPLVFLADTPGFLVGLESEKRRLAGKIMNYMAALELATVPKVALILRKSYGQAYLNMGAGRADVTASWMTGDISFMDPAVAVNVVYGLKRADDPERYDQLVAEVADATTAYALAGPYMAHEVMDPRETRGFVTDMLSLVNRGKTGGIGEHRLAAWPPAF